MLKFYILKFECIVNCMYILHQILWENWTDWTINRTLIKRSLGFMIAFDILKANFKF